MALLDPNNLDTVVAIGTKKDDWYGTGFFYGQIIDEKEGFIAFLVTNKHIIDRLIDEDKKQLFLKCNSKGYGTAKIQTLDLYDENDEPMFFCHTDKQVDLATVFIPPTKLNRMVNEIEIKVLNSKMILTIDEMKEKGVCEGDSIFVFGFPMNNININQKSVIVRNGSIASIRDLFYSDNKEFMLDSFIFPGNSGGPVFIKPEVTNLKGTKSIKESYLIGVVKEYLPYEDIAKSEQTGYIRVIFTENSGLALAHPMDFVTEVINIFKNKFKF